MKKYIIVRFNIYVCKTNNFLKLINLYLYET